MLDKRVMVDELGMRELRERRREMGRYMTNVIFLYIYIFFNKVDYGERGWVKT